MPAVTRGPRCAAYATEDGWPSHAVRLAATLHRYLENGGHYPEAMIIHRQARRAARAAGDRAGEACRTRPTR
jgi:hypothetical protein